MLKVGFFEDFKGADTLSIWGDEQGLARLQQLLARLSSGTSSSAAIHEIEDVHIRLGLRIILVSGPSELRIERNDSDVVIVASCSADLLASLADKIAGLADPKQRSGHQYLEWPGSAGIVVMVSKGEYPEGFGEA
jgi:hypothetical protein